MSKAKVEVTPTIRAETALTPQAAVGESARPDAYVHAPQGLFPAPLPPAERASGAPVWSWQLAWVQGDGDPAALLCTLSEVES